MIKSFVRIFILFQLLLILGCHGSVSDEEAITFSSIEKSDCSYREIFSNQDRSDLEISYPKKIIISDKINLSDSDLQFLDFMREKLNFSVQVKPFEFIPIAKANEPIRSIYGYNELKSKRPNFYEFKTTGTAYVLPLLEDQYPKFDLNLEISLARSEKIGPFREIKHKYFPEIVSFGSDQIDSNKSTFAQGLLYYSPAENEIVLGECYIPSLQSEGSGLESCVMGFMGNTMEGDELHTNMKSCMKKHFEREFLNYGQ